MQVAIEKLLCSFLVWQIPNRRVHVIIEFTRSQIRFVSMIAVIGVGLLLTQDLPRWLAETGTEDTGHSHDDRSVPEQAHPSRAAETETIQGTADARDTADAQSTADTQSTADARAGAASRGELRANFVSLARSESRDFRALDYSNAPEWARGLSSQNFAQDYSIVVAPLGTKVSTGNGGARFLPLTWRRPGQPAGTLGISREVQAEGNVAARSAPT